MKVLAIVYDTGGHKAAGTDPVILSERRLLREAGHDHVLVAGNEDRCGGESKAEYVLPELFAGPRAPTEEVVRIILSERPNIVHFHLIPPWIQPSLISMLSRVLPTVFTVHHGFLTCPSQLRISRTNHSICQRRAGLGCLVEAYRRRCNDRRPLPLLRSYVQYASYRRAVSHIGGFIVLSSYLSDQLAAGGVARSRIFVVSQSMSYMLAGGRSPAASAPTILFVGRIRHEKGLHLLIRACSLLKNDYRLLVVGDGPDRAAISSLAGELGVSSRLTFCGWRSRDQLSDLYQQSTVLVVPSICPEGFGLVGLEAMAHGRPSVAFDVGGVSSWLSDGANGFLARPGDIAGLAEKVDRLLGDRVLALEMGRRGRQLLDIERSPERHLASLMCAYDHACGLFNSGDAARCRVNEDWQ